MTGDRQLPPPGGLHVFGQASGHGRVYQVAQGTMVIHEAGGPEQLSVVVPVLADDVAAPAVFVGRDSVLADLLGLLDPRTDGPWDTVVSAVAGLAGVGKTALARRAASVAAGRGWFPGGVLLVDLHGYDPHTFTLPGQVFAALLHAFGLAGAQIPRTPTEQASMYHQVLAEWGRQGRAVLLVLDNASTSAQVADLLPAHRAHRVLITSRHTLGDLSGVRVLDLDILPAREAVAVLDASLRQRDPAAERITRHPIDADRLAGLCAGLPLALQITAALLAEDPDLSLAGLAAALSDTATRLETLAYGERAVASAFDLSWQHLHDRDKAAARLFRLLPTNPGPEISTEAAAALASRSAPAAARLLRTLLRAHLVERGTTGGRWRMHDLVRLYATRLADTHPDPDDDAAAVDRLFAHYQTTTAAADDHVWALPGQPVPDQVTGLFTDRDQALAWLDVERPNLIAAVDLAAATGRHHIAADLALNLAGFLRWRRYTADHVAVATVAVRAATDLGEHPLLGDALNNLGNALSGVRRLDEAIAAYQQAFVISVEIGDRRREGRALNNLGLVLAETRRLDEAMAAYERSLAISREIGDRDDEGGTLANIGIALVRAGRFDDAIANHKQAAAIFIETGHRHGEGGQRYNIGLALREMRRFEEAVAAYQQAAVIYAETHDRHGVAAALDHEGAALQQIHRFDEAIAAHEQAAVIYAETGDRHGEATALNNLEQALAEAGNPGRARMH